MSMEVVASNFLKSRPAHLCLSSLLSCALCVPRWLQHVCGCKLLYSADRQRSMVARYACHGAKLASVVCRCVYQREDEKGAVGVELNRDLVKVAGKALEKNMTRMGPLVLPMSEQLRFAANWVARKALGRRDLKKYVPNFTKAFDHFCLHAGAHFVLSARCPRCHIVPDVSSSSDAVQSGRVMVKPARFHLSMADLGLILDPRQCFLIPCQEMGSTYLSRCFEVGQSYQFYYRPCLFVGLHERTAETLWQSVCS